MYNRAQGLNKNSIKKLLNFYYRSKSKVNSNRYSIFGVKKGGGLFKCKIRTISISRFRLYTKRCVENSFLIYTVIEKWHYTWSLGWLRTIRSSVFFHSCLFIPCMLTFRILSKTRACCSSFFSSSADNLERCLNQKLFIRKSEIKRLMVFDSCAPASDAHELKVMLAVKYSYDSSIEIPIISTISWL